MKQRVHTVSVTNLTKGKRPRLPFEDIKRAVLGARYELSLVFAPSSLSRTLHKRYQHKDGPANVLSFPLSKTSGEMFIDPAVAAHQARDFGRTPAQFVGYLFIHGLLHLKGHRHSSKMEAKERHFREKFGV